MGCVINVHVEKYWLLNFKICNDHYNAAIYSKEVKIVERRTGNFQKEPNFTGLEKYEKGLLPGRDYSENELY